MFKIEAIVVGAGVIGLSIARALAARGLEVLVLEQEPGIGQGISSRNSEVIHAGLYYEPGSLKARLCVEGRRALYQYCGERNVPHQRCGKLVVTTATEEDAALGAIKARADANGVEDIALIGAANWARTIKSTWWRQIPPGRPLQQTLLRSPGSGWKPT